MIHRGNLLNPAMTFLCNLCGVFIEFPVAIIAVSFRGRSANNRPHFLPFHWNGENPISWRPIVARSGPPRVAIDAIAILSHKHGCFKPKSLFLIPRSRCLRFFFSSSSPASSSPYLRLQSLPTLVPMILPTHRRSNVERPLKCARTTITAPATVLNPSESRQRIQTDYVLMDFRIRNKCTKEAVDKLFDCVINRSQP